MKNANIVKYISLALAVLIVALLVMQFLPFWSTEEEMVSINGYVWMPKEHKDLTKMFRKLLDDKKFTVSRIILWPMLTLFMGIGGIITSVIKREEKWPFLLTIGCGLSGVLTYVTSPLLRMGANWVLHLVVASVVLLAGIGGLVLHLLANKKVKE